VTYLDRVLFATPGMLHAGTSLETFKKWCHGMSETFDSLDPKNMVIMPGYCVAGTVGAKVLAGEKEVEIDKWTKVSVNMQVKNLSFSAHADAKGIIQLIRMCNPRAIVLVHGEKGKMGFLKHRIMSELGIPTFDPANAASLDIYTDNPTRVLIEKRVVETAYDEARRRMLKDWREGKGSVGPIVGEVRYSGRLVFSNDGDRIMSAGGKEYVVVEESKPVIQKFSRPWRSTGADIEQVLLEITAKMEGHGMEVCRRYRMLVVDEVTVDLGVGSLSIAWVGERRSADVVITLVNQVLM
jgi:hypothetical protein